MDKYKAAWIALKQIALSHEGLSAGNRTLIMDTMTRLELEYHLGIMEIMERISKDASQNS